MEAVARLADADELFYEVGTGALAERNFIKVLQRQCRQAKQARRHGAAAGFRPDRL